MPFECASVAEEGDRLCAESGLPDASWLLHTAPKALSQRANKVCPVRGPGIGITMKGNH